ncbi:hypothetical protein KAH27_10375, partial [bacterium]|nr:hypothetical protein [bacterium]
MSVLSLAMLLLVVAFSAFAVENTNGTEAVSNDFDQIKDGIYNNYYVEDDFWMRTDYDEPREHSFLVTKMLKFLGVGKWSEFTIPNYLATISKNIGMHCASFDNEKNKEIEGSVRKLHEDLGVGYNVYTGTDKPLPAHLHYRVRQMIDEDIAVNPGHFFLFIICVILCLILKKYRKNPTLIVYFICIIIGFVLLSGWFGWSPYNSRRQLPLFILGAPFIAVILERLTKRPIILETVCVLLLLFSYPWVMHNSIRQLKGKTTVFNMPRNEQYFRKFENLRLPYETVSTFIKEQKYEKVGIFCKRNATEYPLLALIKQKSPKAQIEHIGVDNISAKYTHKEPFIPEIIISLPYEDMGFWFDKFYWENIWTYGGVGIYVRNEVSEQVESEKFKVKGGTARRSEAGKLGGSEVGETQSPVPSTESPEPGNRVYGKLKADLDDKDLTLTNNVSVNKNIDPLTHRPADLSAAVWQIFNDLDSQIVKNGRFLDGMDDWHYWQYGSTHTNKIIVKNNVLRIENPFKKLIGVQQQVNVVSGTVYKLSGVARSVATTQSDIIFGGRIAFFLPPQKEQQLVWTSEYNQWSQKELIFTNEVTGTASILIHLGYG